MSVFLDPSPNAMSALLTKSESPLLLFYPTSPVHVTDLRLLAEKLPRWRYRAVVYEPLARVAPGVAATLREEGFDSVALDSAAKIVPILAEDTAAILLGAAFEPFALELLAWGKRRCIPVCAIEEVAQLALNQMDINNYDAPFDRFFVASPEEFRLFKALGYPADTLRISGLLANDRITPKNNRPNKDFLTRIGISTGDNPIVYTTSPIKSRLALHNKDDAPFREALLEQLARASRSAGRKIIIKLHPNENLESNQALIRRIIPDAIVIGREWGMDQLFQVTAVLVNRGNSQTCLEAVLRGIPTVVAACGLRTLFHDERGAYVVDDLRDLESAIITALDRGPPDTSRIRAKHSAAPAGGVASFIAREIESVAGTNCPAQESSWNWIIKSMLFMGKHDRALAISDSLDPISAWRQQVNNALRAHVDGQLENAIGAWLECAALEPNWYFPHYELAHAFLALDEPENALAHAEDANKLHPPYHRLWHELPMEIVAMNALRRMGKSKAARDRIKNLEARGLTDIVPELLIEKAAQQDITEQGNKKAEQCLANAFRLLGNYPVDEKSDSDITQRAIWQYLEIAKRYTELGKDKEVIVCFRKATDLAFNDARLSDRSHLSLLELAERCARRGDQSFAQHCCQLVRESNSIAPWSRFRLARVATLLGQYGAAVRQVHRIARVPGATREVIETALSPAVAARLAPYWPGSPRSIAKPLKLLLLASACFLRRVARLQSAHARHGRLLLLLLWVYVARHFIRRLRAEITKLCGLAYGIRTAGHKCAYFYRVSKTSCPICGGSGKFEYRNELTPLFRCRSCDHVYARDLPDDKALNTLYGDFSYWEKDRYHQGITAIEESEQWGSYLDSRIGILDRLGLMDPTPSHTKKVFEIGCAEGMLLHEMSKRGFNVTGCEMNQAVATQGAKSLGVTIFTEPFEKLDRLEQGFDLIMSFHTLEHMRNPVSVLEKAAQILRPDGAILIEVPCGEEEYENTDHLHFFSEKSLKLLLQSNFAETEILPNGYTNSAGVQIGSIYGVGRGVRNTGKRC
jgi:SAM-dependent methyltransferase/tetratricopeptide (TPR) repeat protein